MALDAPVVLKLGFRTVTPLPFVWPWLTIYWITCFWVFWPEMRLVNQSTKPAAQADSPDAGSLRVIMIGGMLSLLLAYPLAWVAAGRFPASVDIPVYLFGMAIIVAASLLRRHCFKQLGDSFTGNVRASADQKVVTTGAYSILRHPSYTAGILMNVGIGVALGSWASTLLLGVAGFATYAYRIRVEERTLADVIGEPYREFMRTRKRLIPFVY